MSTAIIEEATTSFTFNDFKSKARAEYETENFKINILAEMVNRKADDRTVVYGEGETEVDFSAAYEFGKSLETGLRRGENKELDKMFDVLNAEVKRNKRAVIDEAIAESSLLASILADVNLRWSDKAGCTMCKCSPGFKAVPTVEVILETEDTNWEGESVIRGRRYTVTNVWVTKK